MLMAISAVSPKSRAWLPVRIDDPALLDAQKLVLADHRTRHLDHCSQHIEGTATEPYRPGRRQDLETAELHHRGRDRRGEPWAMIKIDISKENHRSSD